MLPEIALQSMYPVIMTPSHDGKYSHNCVLSLLNLLHDGTARGLRMQISLLHGESLITRARNNCVAQFLANPDWTHLFWVDSDIGFTPQAAYRLLLSDYDIAVGAYPQKFDHWMVEGLPSELNMEQFNNLFATYGVHAHTSPNAPETTLAIQEDGFLKIKAAPLGFSVIKRQVFEQLVVAHPDYRYIPDHPTHDEGFHYRFFDTAIDPDSQHYLSEDLAFCQLWRQHGGEIYLDAYSNLNHQGIKLFTGNFSQSLINDPAKAVQCPPNQPIVLSGVEHLMPHPTHTNE